MAIVLGETYTLRLSVEATVKGVTVAILVGIVITMLSPFAEATSEILARHTANHTRLDGRPGIRCGGRLCHMP